MTHYRMLDRAPSVIITSNKNELKIYQGNLVYLNDGDNFELKFFNPTMEKIGIEVLFNGIKKGDSYLVLNPGQDLTLDRFLDEQRKMVFETYTIDGNNEAAIKAIEQNGVITFNFYKECNYRRLWSDPAQNDININYNFPPKPTNYSNSTSGKSGYRGASGTSGIAGSTGYMGASGTASFAGSAGSTIQQQNISYTCQSTYSNYNSRIYNSPGIYADELDCSENIVETGRIEKGDISNQEIKSVNIQFDTQSFHTISYKLLPYSQMNKTIKEVRVYCTECGYRLRKENWKFCPKCGSKID